MRYDTEILIRRKVFIIPGTIALLVSSLAILTVRPSHAHYDLGAETDRPPNIVLIFTDDQGYQDVGCFGSPDIRTPHLDRMAKEGMKFTDFYVAAPICSASRAALLTGSYCQRVSVTGVLFPNAKVGLNPDEITIAEVLKSRGYATACIGKWHLGHLKPFLPTNQGFDDYYGIPYSNDMRIKREGKSGPPVMRNEEIVEHPADQANLTKRYTEEAVAFIKKNKDKPFFLYLPHTMPHVPLGASDAFRGKSKRGLYGDVIEEIDWSVGQVLKTLKDLDLDERTLVFFTSDNGPWLGKGKNGGSAKPLRDGKFTTFEGGMRVPCIVRWPGKIPAGSTCSEVAATIDLLPTFAKLAGAKVPSDRIIDGKDIWPLMAGEKDAKSPHEAYYFYRGNNLQAVRSGKWKLHLRGKKKGKSAGVLFDLEADIGEKNDVAADHSEVVERLAKLASKFDAELKKNKRPAGNINQQKAKAPKKTAKTPAVTTLPSGLKYKIIKAGTGPSPKRTDKVKVHYRGTLLDGTEFDSSYKRGQPAKFKVNGVIKGWTEALQLMKVGAKWQLIIPPDLAYGQRGTPGGPIGPNATLIFEVELLGIE